MKKSTIYGIIWSAYLGASLAKLGLSITDMKFWIIFMPIVIFVSLERKAYHNEEKN